MNLCIFSGTFYSLHMICSFGFTSNVLIPLMLITIHLSISVSCVATGLGRVPLHQMCLSSICPYCISASSVWCISVGQDLVKPWQLTPSLPAARVPPPCDTLAIFLQERTDDLEQGKDPPSLTSVIPEPNPCHAMFVRLPQKAMQSVAPDECCAHRGEQTVCTDWFTWFWITTNFPICLGLKIGRSLIFHSWIVSQCETIGVVSHKGLQCRQISGLFVSNIVQKSRFHVQRIHSLAVFNIQMI